MERLDRLAHVLPKLLPSIRFRYDVLSQALRDEAAVGFLRDLEDQLVLQWRHATKVPEMHRTLKTEVSQGRSPNDRSGRGGLPASRALRVIGRQ